MKLLKLISLLIMVLALSQCYLPQHEWRSGYYYREGNRVSYQGLPYSCRQSHTSQADWTPCSTPSLWQKL